MARYRILLTLLLVLTLAGVGRSDEGKAAKVSYFKQVRPILQAHCQGCHQPAKQGGGYVMTDFAALVKGGESESAAIVPGKPKESNLIELITPADGKAEMPKGKKPLSKVEIELITKWITEGAKDDTPANAQKTYDKDHPPIYTRPPVITSIDFSPDGKLLAVAGFHEVLLVDANASKVVGRLIGMAERIESVQFSPDGKRLAVTGGLPARLGEIQVWDVAKRELQLSVPMTYETIFGGSWSPDGKRIAFGCADNTVRAIDAQTGEQLLFQGAHNDWVRDTIFSVDGSHVVSVGRDMTVKLTEFKTQRFIDNITSITPGVLKGGLATVARHPSRDEIIIGGSDGIAKVYRMHRLTKRVIGDDANMIRRMPPLKGRIFGVAVSKDGKRFAACSSLNGKGQIQVYSYEFDTSMPDEIKKINEIVVTQRNADQRKKLEAYHTNGVKVIASADLDIGLYAIAFRPDNKAIAVAGADGSIRIFDAANGKQLSSVSPAPITKSTSNVADNSNLKSDQAEPETKAEALPKGTTVKSLVIRPAKLQFTNHFEYSQMVVTATLSNGQTVDVTRLAKWQGNPSASVTPSGFVRPKSDGSGQLTATIGGKKAVVPVVVKGLKSSFVADFVRDVNPALSRLGCNAGTCHGADKGKNGFKLSLRGYDAIFDVRALTDDLASRRVSVASPDDSMVLLKPVGAAPHVGGKLFSTDTRYYQIVRNWISNGAKLNNKSAKVERLELFPQNPVIERIGGRQQFSVIAVYADGSKRDVTRDAFIDSALTEVATTSPTGLISGIRRGEAAVLVRYEGAYAATTVTVMGDRTGFVWNQPWSYNPVDALVAKKWERLRIEPSGLCTDSEFVRRVYLDLTGLPPTSEQVRAFLADEREQRLKREELVDKLIGSDAFVDYWTNKWADLLQVNRKFLAPEGAKAFREWIRDELAANTPYDQFVRKIITASGSNRENPQASYYKVLRDPMTTMENTTHLFLAVRFNCNKCHDHPFEKWTQDQYYETAAYFAQFELKRDPKSGNKRIGGTAVEGAKPLYEIVADKKDGEVTHLRTGSAAAPKLPFDCKYETKKDATRREQFAAWLTSADNPYFARSYVNRIWGYLLGVGIMEPIDDLRAGNPPTNPELLDFLTKEFIDSGFNVRHVMQLVCKSRTYQLSVESNKWNDDDKTNYSHAVARRLPAEVLYDAIHHVTGAPLKIPGVPEGTRAAQLPDVGVKLPDGFLTNLGRPPRESACECERSNDLQLGPVMALISGPTVGNALADSKNAISKLAKSNMSDQALIDELFLRVLNRRARPREVKAALSMLSDIDADHAKLLVELKEREIYSKPIRDKAEKARLGSLKAKEAEVKAYEKEIAPKRAQLEKERVEKIKKTEKDLADYLAKGFKQKVGQWERQRSSGGSWKLMKAAKLAATGGTKLAQDKDLSIRSEGTNNKSVFTVTTETNLKDITGIRLEVLTNDKLPGKGPGRNDDGNFVLSEIEVFAAPKSDPKKQTKIALMRARSDFDQPNFPVSKAIDNVLRGNNGWAVAGATGGLHWATFETAKGFGFDGGTIITFKMHHAFVFNKFLLGRFRLSVTDSAKPLGLGLPEDLRKVLALAPKQRKPEQLAAVATYFKKIDNDFKGKTAAIAAAKKPVPPDAKLVAMKSDLEALKKPSPEDVKLVQLRKDVEMSKKQVSDKRLTMSQDLVWALINSPAFLFNH